MSIVCWCSFQLEKSMWYPGWSHNLFLSFHPMRELWESRKAANTSRKAANTSRKAARKKSLVFLFPCHFARLVFAALRLFCSSLVMKNQEKPLGQVINVKKEDIYFNLLIKGLRNQVASLDLICWQQVLNATLFSCFQSVGSFQPLIDTYN